MNRRGFLSALGITAAGAATGLAIPELWTPKRTFFLPPRGGWTLRPETMTLVSLGCGELPVDYQWTWIEGSSGLVISREAAARLPGTSGDLEVLVTDSAGHIARAAVRVTVEHMPRQRLTIVG